MEIFIPVSGSASISLDESVLGPEKLLPQWICFSWEKSVWREHPFASHNFLPALLLDEWLQSTGTSNPNLSPHLILVSHLSNETDPLWLLVGAVWAELGSTAKVPNALKYLCCNEKCLCLRCGFRVQAYEKFRTWGKPLTGFPIPLLSLSLAVWPFWSYFVCFLLFRESDSDFVWLCRSWWSYSQAEHLFL